MKKIYWWKNYNILSTKRRIDYNPKINYINKLESKLAKILKVKYVVYTTSGSSALTLAFFCTNINKKKKVIIPDRTWVATAHAAYNLNYDIQLEDTDLNTMLQNIPINQIKNKNNIGCLVLVNLNGRVNDADKYKRIIKNKKIIIIEDNAQSFLSARKNFVSPISKIACYSTGSTKLLNTLQGGFCATNDKKVFQRILLARNHGIYDLFTDKWNSPGFNLKPNNFQCFLGLNELKIAHKKKRQCIKINNLYIKKITNKKVKLLTTKYEKGEFPIYVQALVDNKVKFKKYLSQKGIEIRYLPPSLSESKYLNKDTKKKFKNSMVLSKKGVYLPCGPSQNLKSILYAIKVINKY
tara:strand:+ start:231 stop:1286 length:1056 start_codon:yes stop_codon:yes gene_type:complete